MGYNVGITLAGYYNEDEEIFSKINLPEGLDKNILTYQILTDVGNLYPALQEPTILKKAIHNWFDSNYHNFERILLAINADYSPIENYDRTEEHIISRNGNESESGSNHSDRSESNITNTDETTNSSTISSSVTSTDGSETDQRAADNSESFRNTNKRISEADSSGTDNSTNTTTGTNTTNASLTEYDSGGFQTGRERSENETEKIRAHGNIGTTRNSEMVFDEIELRKYNIYEDIVSRFADKFLICVF